MTFVRTSPTDQAQGYFACDAFGCSAKSPTLRVFLGPLPPEAEGWVVSNKPSQVRDGRPATYCADHAAHAEFD